MEDNKLFLSNISKYKSIDLLNVIFDILLKNRCETDILLNYRIKYIKDYISENKLDEYPTHDGWVFLNGKVIIDEDSNAFIRTDFTISFSRITSLMIFNTNTPFNFQASFKKSDLLYALRTYKLENILND